MTRRIITSDESNPHFCAWLQAALPNSGNYDPTDFRTIGHLKVGDDGSVEVLGVVGFNRWTPHTCEGTIASDGTKRLASRAFIFTVYDYVFRHAGKSRVNFFVREDNPASIALQNGLGHKHECTLTDWFGPGIDGLMFGVTKADWLAGKYATPTKLGDN